MDKNVHQSAYIRRGTVLLLVLTLLVQLCPTFVFADSGDDMMIGTAPYEAQGGCLITQVNEPVYEGDTSLYVTGRTDVWHGAKWNAKDTVTEPGVYCFIAYVRADAESDGQRLSYLLNAGGNYFTFAEVTLSAEHWTRMYGVARLEQVQIDAVCQNGYADVYPLSSGTGNYYIDSVSLSLLPEDDMSICGAEPYAQGGSISRAYSVVYVGNDSLLAEGRTESYHGAAWSVPASSLGTLADKDFWTLHMQVRAASGNMTLGYNLEFWYNDGTPNKYLNASAALTDSVWTTLTGTWTLEDGYITDALDRVVIYPASGETELGSYYIDDVSLTGSYVPDDMTLCGVEPHAQGGSIRRVTDPVYTGRDSLLSEGREAFYNGAAWTIPASSLGELTEKTVWTLQMQARSALGGMTLGYNLEFWYNDGTPNKYLNASAALTDSEWTALTGTWTMEDDFLTDALDRVVIYPASGETELGSYYIDDVSLTGSYAPDDMTLCGVEPHAQGCSIRRVTDPVYTGRDSLLSEGREAFYNGAAWEIPAEKLGSLLTNTTWTLSLFARSASGTMKLAYNIELWYSDNVADCRYYSTSAEIGTEWTELKGRFEMPESDMDGLKRVVIYPATGETQLGDYYIDAPTFTGAPTVQLDDMTLCGVEPHAQGGSIRRVTDPVYTGRDSLLSEGREAFYNGAAWEIPAEKLGSLLTNTTWTLSLFARSASGTMKLAYNIELWYSDNVADCRYYSASAEIGTEWTELKGRFEMPASDMDGLKRVVIYPTTGESQLGDYYIDAPTLTGAPTVQLDDMTLCGVEPHAQGGSIRRVTDPVYTGRDSLLSEGREAFYNGAAWEIPAEKLGSLLTNTTWTLSLFARSASETMTLAYNIELWYSDNVADCRYYSAGAEIGTEWTELKGRFEMPASDMDGLKRVVIYPTTGESQLGDYYIDAPTLTGAPTVQHDDMTIGGKNYFVHGSGTLERTTEAVYAGEDSLLVKDRTLPYSGAGYDVCAYLKKYGWGNWFVSAYAMAVDEPMSLSYSIYLRFEDGTEDWLSPGTSYYVTSAGWKRINTDFCGGDKLLRGSRKSYDFSKLEAAVLYPCTGEGQLGAYYLDEIKLYRGSDDYTEPVIPFTSFPLDGDFEKELDFGAPGCLFVHGEGALLERVEEDGGNHCLRVSNRVSSYSGAGWVVTDYLKQEGWGDWYCTARAKSIDGEYLALSYSIYMQFDDGTEGWLTSGVMTFLSNKIWQTINLDTAGNPAVLKPTDGAVSLDFSKLTYAVLYPGTSPDGGPNENLYSDYYLDDVRLWREDPKGTEAPEETAPPAVKPQQTPTEAERPLWPWIVGGAGAAAIAVGVILLITRKKHRRTK